MVVSVVPFSLAFPVAVSLVVSVVVFVVVVELLSLISDLWMLENVAF